MAIFGLTVTYLNIIALISTCLSVPTTCNKLRTTTLYLLLVIRTTNILAALILLRSKVNVMVYSFNMLSLLPNLMAPILVCAHGRRLSSKSFDMEVQPLDKHIAA